MPAKGWRNKDRVSQFLGLAALFVAFFSLIALAPKIFPQLSRPSKADSKKHAAPADPPRPGCGGCLSELVGIIITIVVTLVIGLALLIGLIWLIKRIWQSV